MQCEAGERRVVEVVAAAIIDGARVLATQRGYGEWDGWWEFPGGKVEQGEGREEALRRELREELRLEVEVGERLASVDYDYPQFHLRMHLYQCRPLGRATLGEHRAARWLGADELESVEWLPADLELLPRLKALLA
ncbi:MAG: NUDIX domain-containing protein [Bacteroidales bacterium]|nr:NUDIX domain-containing protein [Bacteroidales bacterium]